MKLSEMDTNQFADCLCGICEPLGRMAEDKSIVDTMKDVLPRMQGLPQGMQAIRFTTALLPVLLGSHKADTFEVLGVLCGKSAGEIAKQSKVATLKDFQDCYDHELVDFFISAVTTSPEK